jgi:hypothetical protein
MGQQIEVGSRVVGTSVIFDTDRTITGQDGAEFTSPAEAAADDAFPNVLAQRLFEADAGISSVFIASNVVTVTRADGWDDPTVAAASSIVGDFFVYYDE